MDRAVYYRDGRPFAVYALDCDALRLMVWTTAEQGWEWRIA